MGKFTTSRGVEIEFLPIPRETMLRFQAANPEPQPPTYEVVSINGVREQHPHDETTVSTAEEKAALVAYEEKQSERALRFVRFFSLRGIKVNASMDEWKEEQAFIGIPMPENKAELRFAWLTECVLGTPDDYRAVMIGVYQASGVPEDLLAQIEATFRDSLPGQAAGATPDSAGAVDGQPGV